MYKKEVAEDTKTITVNCDLSAAKKKEQQLFSHLPHLSHFSHQLDISVNSRAHCRGRRAPWRIHVHGARLCVVGIGDPYTIFLRTVMRTLAKFYFGMSYLKSWNWGWKIGGGGVSTYNRENTERYQRHACLIPDQQFRRYPPLAVRPKISGSQVERETWSPISPHLHRPN